MTPRRPSSNKHSDAYSFLGIEHRHAGAAAHVIGRGGAGFGRRPASCAASTTRPRPSRMKQASSTAGGHAGGGVFGSARST
ncbi:MAG: hypothetical protein U1F67_12980 [Rubrivivax sp.]